MPPVPNAFTPMDSSIVITGFLGNWNRRVGELVAGRLSLPFLDLNSLILQRAGPALSGASSGEWERRRHDLESELIRSLSGRQPFVLATGGETIDNPENAELLRLYGMVVVLRPPPTIILKRLSRTERQPTLEAIGDRATRIRQLRREIEPAYALADYSVDTSRISPEAAAEQVGVLYQRWLSEDIVEASLQRDPYRIHIKDGILWQVGERLATLGLRGKVLVLSDRHVASLYAPLVVKGLKAESFEPFLVCVPPGERSKSRSRAWSILDEMVSFGMTRDSTVVALGGGVVGDLAGFVAGLYMRGTNLVQIPTSLLAQVDSSVGGKVAIDHPCAKNLIGTFFQPRLVLIDPLCLRTLPLREFRCGLAEVVKHAAIADRDLFAHLERNVDALLRRDSSLLRSTIRQCCQIKAGVVLQDERETLGKREVLNFGHTFGHALEVAGGYSRLKHGEAVSIGMVAAARLSAKLGLVPEDVPVRLASLLSRLGLPISVPTSLPVDRLPSFALDKKARSGRPRFVLLDEGLGNTTIVSDPPAEAVASALQPS